MKKSTFITVVCLILLFVVMLPFTKVPMLKVPAFMLAYDTTLVFNSLLTALFFFVQFAHLDERKYLALASGYFFDALTAIPHALSFPELFAPSGLIGGNSQTTAWLYYLWHGGFPFFIMAYVMLDTDSERERTPRSKAITILGLIIGTIVLVGFLTILTTRYITLFPSILADSSFVPNTMYVQALVWGLGIAALFVLARKDRRSALDMWLLVVMCSWIFDVAISAILNGGRYDFGFYAGRVYGLVAAGFILVMLLIESGELNRRLLTATGRLREYSSILETQLIQSQKMEAIGTLTGGMAHDFNNLLGIIIGNVDMYNDKDTHNDKETATTLQEILDAALTAAKLTKMMLAFASQQPLQLQSVDINEAIRPIIKLLERTLGQQIEIVLNLSTDACPVIIDRLQLETTITNLATNARDAKSGRIIISTRNVGTYVEIEFSDTGTGISPEIIDRIYDPFFTTKEQGKGTGLGLSMVYGFVKQSGGKLEVSSTGGVGTTFCLFFPLEQELV